MRTKRTKRAFCAVVLAAVLPAPVAAVGATSWYGSNFTKDLDSRREVMACDREGGDGNIVRGDYTPNGTSSIHVIVDDNGANNSCAHSGSYSKRIYRHRVVEVRTLAPDGFGAWVYP